MSQFGVAPDRVTINAQIDYAIKQGRPDEAVETFERALDGVSKPRFRNAGFQMGPVVALFLIEKQSEVCFCLAVFVFFLPEFELPLSRLVCTIDDGVARSVHTKIDVEGLFTSTVSPVF